MHLSTFSERERSETVNDSSGPWPCHTLPPARPWTMVQVPLLLASGTCVASTMITFDGLIDKQEHLAILFGELREGVPPLVRLHSECLTGDVFGSARCDCGPQLRESLETMARTGGLILYLRQEGRGIGLYNKLKAYQIQDQGYDTFEANRVLLFDDDPRDYAPAAQMLLALGVRELRLLSNNPQKAQQLIAHGLVVAEQIATGTFATTENLRYLQAKVRHAGHRIKLSPENAK
jgi:GTP cyclohydrolase II